MPSSMPVGAPEMAAPPEAAPGGDMTVQGAQMGLTAAATSKDISWKVPAGWEEQPPSSMRVGSFLVKGDNGQVADVSVIPLSGDAGGDLANINRWRDQIQLDPLSESDLPSHSESISPGGRTMRMVDFPSKDLLLGNKYKKRLIAVIYQQGSRSWFIKMLGEDATVEAAKPAFLKFLQSLHFNNAS